MVSPERCFFGGLIPLVVHRPTSRDGPEILNCQQDLNGSCIGLRASPTERDTYFEHSLCDNWGKVYFFATSRSNLLAGLTGRPYRHDDLRWKFWYWNHVELGRKS